MYILKRAKILGPKSKKLLRFVLMHGENFETLHVDCHMMPRMPVIHHLPKITELALEYFVDNETFILKLAVLFPQCEDVEVYKAEELSAAWAKETHYGTVSGAERCQGHEFFI
jgi:hypothetical protein